MNPPTLPANYVDAPSHDDFVRTLEMIRHATAPTPDDGGHHEAAHDLADAMLRRVEARKTYERSMCPHEHAVNDWRLHPLTPNAQVQAPAVGGSPGTNS